MDMAFIKKTPDSKIGVKWHNISSSIQEMQSNYELDALLVGSRAMRQELLQNGFSAEKVHIVPPVVRPPSGSPAALTAGSNILYVGQLIRGKGVDLLLRALPGIRVSYKVRIVGDGNARKQLEKMTLELGLTDRVQFLGWINPEKISEQYAWARVVVVPSRWPEPFGMIGLEAMHAGRPVVAFAVGGITDWLIHGVTGLLAPEQDTEALGRAIEEVLTNGEYAAVLGRAAYHRAKRDYSFEQYLDCLESHLMGEGQSFRSKILRYGLAEAK